MRNGKKKNGELLLKRQFCIFSFKFNFLLFFNFFLLVIGLIAGIFGFIFITDLWDSLIEVYYDADRCFKR